MEVSLSTRRIAVRIERLQQARQQDFLRPGAFRELQREIVSLPDPMKLRSGDEVLDHAKTALVQKKLLDLERVVSRNDVRKGQNVMREMARNPNLIRRRG